MPSILKSIHGRLLGITTTYGLAIGSRGSTIIDSLVVTRDSTGARTSPFYEPIVAASSSGASMSNNGISTITFTSATVATMVLQAPVAGTVKRIYSQSTSSSIVIDTSATTIVFQTSGGASSTSLTFGAANNKGEFATLIGLSTARWAAVGKSGGVT
jgi:hypothetical protein